MKLYCRNGKIVAWHAGDQIVDPASYGEGVVAITVDDSFPATLGGLAPEIDLATLKASLKADVDAAAERERLKYITPGAGQAMTYQEKFAELVRYEADSNPVKANYPMLSAEIGVTGSSLGAVASAIRSAYDLWKIVGGEIEASRLKAKANIDKAASAAAAVSAAAVTWPSV